MTSYIKVIDRYKDVQIINVQEITRIYQESLGSTKLPYVYVELSSGLGVSLTPYEAQKIYNVIGMSL